MKKIIVFLFAILTLGANAKEKYLEVECKDGDGVYVLLQKYQLPQNDYYFDKFLELNPGKVKKNKDLYKGSRYKLPILIEKYDSKSIRTSLSLDMNEAQDIQAYNSKLLDKGLISSAYKTSKKLFVPLKYASKINKNEVAEKDSPKSSSKTSSKKSKDSDYKFNMKLFGKNYQKLELSDHSLKGHVFYLSSGHGGPDPGAIGSKDGKDLCEDEYAYDITLRLARKLLEHDASVYMVVNDPNDGIRDYAYLEPDNDEYFLGGDSISTSQSARLTKRAAIMNKYYEKNKNKAVSQTALMIHVDSRYQEKRIDIFYYYRDDNAEGKEIAKTIYNTVKEKYEQNQPGRGYYGTISPRNLLELRKTKPNSVYIELGNIQNPSDQQRFLDPNNRQAIANWLYLGLRKSVKKE
jgi:N-acetylmuramoyl-L-alanine amidase